MDDVYLSQARIVATPPATQPAHTGIECSPIVTGRPARKRMKSPPYSQKRPQMRWTWRETYASNAGQEIRGLTPSAVPLA